MLSTVCFKGLCLLIYTQRMNFHALCIDLSILLDWSLHCRRLFYFIRRISQFQINKIENYDDDVIRAFPFDAVVMIVAHIVAHFLCFINVFGVIMHLFTRQSRIFLFLSAFFSNANALLIEVARMRPKFMFT